MNSSDLRSSFEIQNNF
jgi:hypothetical protein